MKQIFLASLLLLMAGFIKPGTTQNLIMSTEQGKTCKVDISAGPLHDNFIDINIRPVWVGTDLNPVTDNSSVLGFEKSKMNYSQATFLTLIDPTGQEIICSNNLIRLTFEISEQFTGGELSFKFPFFYAATVEKAQQSYTREEFTFKRPRDFSLLVTIQPDEITNKLPPRMVILIPDGVEDGYKPIVDTPVIGVSLLVTDASGIDAVTVNNLSAARHSDSTYSVQVPLKVGYENKLTAVATDKQGLETRKEFAVECRSSAAKSTVLAKNQVVPKITPSDVDLDIPNPTRPDAAKFALIIGNEDYSNFQTSLQTEMNVEFAVHDAEIFKEYAIKVIGIPVENIIFFKNAKAIEMHRAINQICAIIKNTKGQASVYIYYAGHGFPEEQTKEAYLVPVDVSGSDLQFAIRLSDLYKKLTEYPSKKVTLFLDACFSGGGRELGLMAARGVKVKPRESLLSGNLVVFTASSGDQSSLAYRDKQHGMFTYFLLKKLKETGGEVNYADLSGYISSNVGIRSVMVNNKEQNPQTNISPDLGDTWKEWRIK